MMRSAAAVSTGTKTAAAAAQLATTLRSALAATPDLVFLFASSRHADEADALLADIHRELHPRHVVGCSAEAVIGEAHELENEDAVVALAVSAPGARIESFHSEFEPTDGGGTLAGMPLDRAAADPESALIVFADPYSFPMDAVLRHANQEMKGSRIVGGMASGSDASGGNRLFVDDETFESGCAGVLIGGDVAVRPVVSQGCRPIGSHAVVTKCRNNVIEELGGRPALGRLEEILADLDPDDLELVRNSLHVGRAIDEYRSTFGRGDFLIRSVIGFDQKTGAIAINDAVRLGQTLQFQVRDPRSATEDLEHLLAAEVADSALHPARAALLFSCNGRGKRMFAEPDHDAARVRTAFGDLPTAGFFAGGEVGPIGGKNFLHGFTASIALLCDRIAPP